MQQSDAGSFIPRESVVSGLINMFNTFSPDAGARRKAEIRNINADADLSKMRADFMPSADSREWEQVRHAFEALGFDREKHGDLLPIARLNARTNAAQSSEMSRANREQEARARRQDPVKNYTDVVQANAMLPRGLDDLGLGMTMDLGSQVSPNAGKAVQDMVVKKQQQNAKMAETQGRLGGQGGGAPAQQAPAAGNGFVPEEVTSDNWGKEKYKLIEEFMPNANDPNSNYYGVHIPGSNSKIYFDRSGKQIGDPNTISNVPQMVMPYGAGLPPQPRVDPTRIPASEFTEGIKPGVTMKELLDTIFNKSAARRTKKQEAERPKSRTLNADDLGLPILPLPE
jgi:hypothetical protein